MNDRVKRSKESNKIIIKNRNVFKRNSQCGYQKNIMKISIIILFLLLGINLFQIASADRLPSEVDENQIFTIDTEIKAIGIMSEESSVDWTIDYQRLYVNGDYDYGHIHDGKLNRTESIAILQWDDSLRSSGGSIAMGKKISYNSKNKASSRYNLQTEKVLTYRTKEGSHLFGEELWSLDVAGNWDLKRENVRCVFADNEPNYFPAFCNIVKAGSSIVNFNTGQLSTRGVSRAVTYYTQYPAALNYLIAVRPDSGMNSPAMGTIKTNFGGSIMEARNQSNNVSATNNWKETTSATGGIEKFQKKFTYESGLKF